MKTILLGCALAGAAIAAGCVGTTPARLAANDSAAGRRRMELLSRSVFEVDVPKLEDPAAEYADPLPVDLLPFRERHSKLWSRGTAFAIGPNRFVTAAHVLPATATLEPKVYLRSATGMTYEVGRILKYSQYRDLAEFELVSPPNNVAPFELAGTGAQIGDSVVAIGNALGEGIVFRGGAVTSFTPEEMDGRWQFIRFTAPASPGNSGGPLIDEKGRVIGVVVRKSQTENLNYAVPIGELDKLSATESEFWTRGWSFGEDDRQLFSEWRFASPLPSSLPDLRAAAERSRLDNARKGIADFDAKYAADVFPRHPNLKSYLRRPTIPLGVGRFFMDGNGRWSLAHDTYTKREIAPGQWVSYLSKEQHAELVLDRPRDVPLSQFFGSPKALADSFLKILKTTRPFAGKSIPIRSLGQPVEQERWVDEQGRPWFTSVWHFSWADDALVLDCLTNPGGVACRWQILSVSAEKEYRLRIKRDARRLTFSYYGRLKDWTEFLALPPELKPKALSAPGTVVHLDKTLTLDLGGFRGTFRAPSLSEDSVLTLFSAPDGSPAYEPVFYEVRVKLRTDKATRFGIERHYAPTETSPEDDAHLWGKLKNAEAPFNGAVEFDGKENVVRIVRKPEHPTDPDVRYIYYCRNGPEDDKNDLPKACTEMSKTLAVAARP